MNRRRRTSRNVTMAIGLLTGLSLTLATAGAKAQGLLYSYETGLEGWGPTGYSGTRLISVGTSTTGATLGAQSMVVETGGNYSWDVRTSVTAADTTRYPIFNAVAHDLSKYTLDFDVSTAADSFTGLANQGDYFLLSVAVNSSLNNFATVFNVSPNLKGLVGRFPISIPMNDLPLAIDSGYYQININSNSNQTNGAMGQGAKYYIDNMRFTKTPTLASKTLFSWETADNPGTPVNEQFEGWTQGTPGFAENQHMHSIGTLGATQGTHSLQIDRTAIPGTATMGPSFTWGSQYAISGGAANPANQAIIDQLVSGINGAQSIAFDVRFDDSFPNTPTFTKFGLHITDHRSDGSYSFFQKEGTSYNGTQTIGSTATVIIPLASLTDGTLGTLDVAKLNSGTDFLRFGISVNTNGGGIYQIDNFRILSQVALDADFDGNGMVNAQDLAIWKTAFSAHTTAGDADKDGDTDGADYSLWQRQLGNAASASVSAVAVPEPAALLLAGMAAVLCRRARRES